MAAPLSSAPSPLVGVALGVLLLGAVAAQQQPITGDVDAPLRSSDISQALQQAPPAACDCRCSAVRSDGSEATPDELIDGRAQLSCATCCESDDLLEAMDAFLPDSKRTTVGGRSCNEPQGLLSIFLQPTCWQAPAGASCQFPFIVGYNQVVIDCTETGDDKPWCVYDMDEWNTKGEGWGYCAPAPASSAAGGSASAPATGQDQASGSEAPEEASLPQTNLDRIVANLTKAQEESLSAKEGDFVHDVTSSGGLTSAGIAVVTVICVLVVAILVGTGVVIYKLRNRIKQRRHQTFHQMDGKGQKNDGDVMMTPM